MKKLIFVLITVCVVTAAMLGGCGDLHAKAFEYNGFDPTAPDLSGLSTDNIVMENPEDMPAEDEAVNDEGWYPTLIDNFDPNPAYADNHGLNPEVWTTSPHGLRWMTNKENHPEYTNYWCDDMVSVSSDGYAVVRAEYREEHVCAVCNAAVDRAEGDTRGRYTGGFETRKVVDKLDENGNPILNNIGRPIQEDDIIWSQAFGYYETRVRFPRKSGMWSAFWLQSTWQRKIGNDGMDGTEIDVFESAFLKYNDKVSRMGHALIWDGYSSESRSVAEVFNLGDNDLYDGNFHTFGLLWTPTYYVFYIDGQPTWATNGGGVSQVREFLRFTCEIDAGDEYGPHGMKIGAFDHEGTGIFEVDYVRVYQNVNYLESIKNDDDFKGDYTTEN